MKAVKAVAVELHRILTHSSFLIAKFSGDTSSRSVTSSCDKSLPVRESLR